MSSTRPPISGGEQTLRLRPWQRTALDAYESSERPDFLVVATPGAGKTLFALTAARFTMPRLDGRLVVVAPSRHLKHQWAATAERFGFHLDTEWSPGERLPGDVHGIVTTYQQVAMAARELGTVAHGGLTILDEVHHAGDELAWGDAVTAAFSGAARRLSISGTPFRSDTAAIPFLNYVRSEVVPDVEYGYREALGDGGVVRPVFFPRFGGHMEWTAPDGSELSAAFDDPLPRSLANQRLRAALSLDGDWLPAVLGHAHARLQEIRARHPGSAGLVIATDQDHALGVAGLMRERLGVSATVAVSEDPTASEKIRRFAAGDAPWIVAVRMVSEGVDIPRLRVGVHATTTTTELFFRQAVGRIVRHTGDRGRSYMFVPDDPRLRHYAGAIAESRRHQLRSRGQDDGEGRPPAEARGDDEQMSLFAVHSATTTDQPDDFADIFAVHDDADLPDPSSGEGDPALIIDLASLPPVGAEVSPAGNSARRERERQRLRNTRLAREIAGLTGLSHARVNGDLNRLVRVSRVSEATVGQLRRRADAAEAWYERERRRQEDRALRA